MKIDDHTLQMALRGYEIKRAEIDRRIAEIKAHLKTNGWAHVTEAEAVEAEPRLKQKQKRHLSAAGRAAIVTAVRKRWAAHRLAQKAKRS